MTDLRKAAEMALEALETYWLGENAGLQGFNAIKALRQALNCPVKTVDLDKYHSVTFKSPLGVAVYDADGVKWLIDNRGSDYFKSQEWQDKCAGRDNDE